MHVNSLYHITVNCLKKDIVWNLFELNGCMSVNIGHGINTVVRQNHLKNVANKIHCYSSASSKNKEKFIAFRPSIG